MVCSGGVYFTISTETAKDSGTYKKAYQDAQEILSLLQVICSAVEKT